MWVIPKMRNPNIFICLLFTSLMGCLWAEQISTHVIDVKGRAQFRKEGGRVWEPLIRQTKIIEGFTIRTGHNALLEIIIEGIGRIFLQDASVLKFKRLRIDREKNPQIFLRLMSGKFRASLGVTFPYPFFLVESAHGRAEVKGTDFILEAGRKDTKFYVLEGKVEINNIFNAGPPLVLTGDTFSSVKKDGKPSPPAVIPDSVYKEWDIHFKTPIEGAIDQPDPATMHADLITKDMIAEKETLPKPEEKIPPGEIPKEAPKKEDKKEAPKEGWKFSIKHRLKTGYFKEPGNTNSPNYGYTARFGKNSWENSPHWLNFTYMPEFKYGPFGLGLYLPIYIGFRDKWFRPKNYYNWNEYNFEKKGADWIHDFIVKIVFFEFQVWRFAFRIGGLDNVTYGSGFILNGFSNMLGFPSLRVNGLVLSYLDDVHAFNISYFNGDLSSRLLSGWRFNIFPIKTFGWSESKLWQKLSLGISLVIQDTPVKETVMGTHPLFYLFYNVGVVNFFRIAYPPF